MLGVKAMRARPDQGLPESQINISGESVPNTALYVNLRSGSGLQDRPPATIP